MESKCMEVPKEANGTPEVYLLRLPSLLWMSVWKSLKGEKIDNVKSTLQDFQRSQSNWSPQILPDALKVVAEAWTSSGWFECLKVNKGGIWDVRCHPVRLWALPIELKAPKVANGTPEVYLLRFSVLSDGKGVLGLTPPKCLKVLKSHTSGTPQVNFRGFRILLSGR